MSRLLIQNGLVVDTEWTRHADILVEDGVITHIAAEISVESVPEKTEIIDAEGMCILPGIIDAHTHYHLESRGTITTDSFVEGSRAAASGGVTTVIDFADDDPKRGLAYAAEERIRAMEEEMAVDFSLHQGIYSFRPSLADEVRALKQVGVKVIKLFTTYKDVGYMIENPTEIAELLELCKEEGLLVTIHCEDDATITKAQEEYTGSWDASAHADLRPSTAEAIAIRTIGEIALTVDIPIYIVHLSSAAGLEEVRNLRRRGLRMIVETTPHYLFLDRSKLEGEDGPLYVMTPPLREKADTKALQEALLNGEIQVVATDHCAFSREQKLESKDCRTMLPGIPGSQELLSLVYTFAAKSGRIGIQQVVNLLSTAPAKAFGLYPRKGAIRVGSDADLVLFDPDYAAEIETKHMYSAAGYSAYEGMPILGRAVSTYLRGRLVSGDFIYLGISGNGRFVKQRSVGRGKTIMH